MNTNLALTSIIQFGISVFLFLFIAFVTYRLIFDKTLQEVEDSNRTGFYIYYGAVIFSIGYLLTGVSSSLLTLNSFLSSKYEYQELIFKMSEYCIYFIIALLIFVAIINFLGVYSFFLISKKNVFQIVKENNVGGCILLAFILVTLALLTKDSFSLILDSLIPYPKGPALY